MSKKPNSPFAEAVEDDSDAVVVTESATVVNDDLVTARIKGTWKMYWGRSVYDFVDGQRYRIPRDLFNYLKQNSNIYDTL